MVEINMKSDFSIQNSFKSTDCCPEQLLSDLQQRQVELEFKLIELENQNEHLQSVQTKHEESKRYYADLFHNAPVGYLTLTDKGLISEVNIAATKLFGIDRQNLLSRRFASLVTAQDSERWHLFYREVNNHKQQRNIALSLKVCGNTEVSVLLACLPINSMLRITLNHVTTTIVADMSQVKTAKDDLEDLEALKFILNNTPVLIGYWDTHLKNRFSNSSYARWFNKTPRQIKGKHIRQTIGEQLYSENLPHMNAALRGEPQQFERNILSPDSNKTIYTQLNYLPHIINRQVVGFYVLGIDITDKNQLHETSFQKRAIFESLNQGIFITDKNKNITYTNQAIRQLTGYSAEEMLGQSYALLHGKNTNPEQILQMREMLNQCKAFQGEVINYRKDGSEFWNGLIISPIFDTQGNLSQFVGFINDITERKYKDNQNKEHLDQLAHVTRLGLMGELASGIAHEVNQPLTAIATYAQVSLNLIKKENPDLSKIVQIAIKTQEQALRAGQIIHRMRRLCTSKSQQLSTIAINELISDCVNLCADPLTQNSIAISFELAENLPDVNVDYIQIEQVIINLIRNSIDAILGVSDSHPGKIIVKSHFTANNQIQVSVKDNGPGIEKGGCKKIRVTASNN